MRAEAFMSKGVVGMRDYLNNNVFTISENIIRTAVRPWFAERFDQAYRSELAAFLRSLSDGVTPAPNELDGLRANILAEAAAKSFMEGRPITLSDVA
ncbi:hypothetical protein GCM10007981_11120 [Thermocladium modestius]|uniref:Gfo/Idh/MocA-like oxidoreductase C-terminal domain-containing protein n=1 Tax=Thermocladium modestius TaxID=62609 RepID=A0A830GTM5_9CREN|nr:Gfo/Idh/MocA family oxidoreductase [Thermocladium modestius]GGP20956.1 hypothetical protein GCM10007981_11120 [Thermocladium modestius]